MNSLADAKSIVRKQNGWMKSNGLGNDYIVFDAGNISFDLDKETIIRICNQNYGIGSDGILAMVETDKADFGLRIFNPDGSEAEKSGNGIRIFVDFLYSMGYTSKSVFDIEVGGEIVVCEIMFDDSDKIKEITVDIGKATFVPSEVPVNCDEKQVLNIPLLLDGMTYMFSAVSVGNPHAVCIVSRLEDVDVRRIGALAENHPIFPNRTNVQFAQIIDRNNVKIEIWERGAGYTLASGTSSCGAVAVLHKKGFVGNEVNVLMPGGTLHVGIDEHYRLKLTGPVTRVACGILL